MFYFSAKLNFEIERERERECGIEREKNKKRRLWLKSQPNTPYKTVTIYLLKNILMIKIFVFKEIKNIYYRIYLVFIFFNILSKAYLEL